MSICSGFPSQSVFQLVYQEYRTVTDASSRDRASRLRQSLCRLRDDAARLTERYRVLRRARARLCDVHAEILDVIDRLEALGRQEP